MMNQILFGIIPILFLYFYILRSERLVGITAGCINLGKICDPKELLKEIEDVNVKLGEKFHDKKYMQGASKQLYKDTKGWQGISLINETGKGGSEGLRYGGTANVFKTIAETQYFPTEYLKQSQALQELFATLERKYNTRCGLARILKLEKGGYIAPHIDYVHPSSRSKVRCHIPIVTQYPDIYMTIDERNYFLEPGNLYMTDVSKRHSVRNNSAIDRIHIVVDLERTALLQSAIERGNPAINI